MSPRPVEQTAQIDADVIGPTCCGRYQAQKTLCMHCVANGMYRNAICFTKPTVGKGADYETQREQTTSFTGGET